MKVARIIGIMQTYVKLKKQIREDEIHYKDYTLFDYDEDKANIYKMRLDFDNEALGRFLDEEV